jgi:hypothetical protein
MAKVSKLAAEFKQKEYLAPMGPPACGELAAECLDCYKRHPGDPLQCATSVAAYSACTQEAQVKALMLANA